MQRRKDERFEIIQSPDASWMVFDGATMRPAELDDEALIGLTFESAQLLARGLNAGHFEEERQSLTGPF
jgi:hypothetical protein